MAKQRQELGLFNEMNRRTLVTKKNEELVKESTKNSEKFKAQYNAEIEAQEKANEVSRKLEKQNLQQTINKEPNTNFNSNLQMDNIYLYIIALVVILVLRTFYKFYRDLKKDDADFKNNNLKEKFNVLFDGLNSHCYNGEGKYTEINKRDLTLYKEGSNQILKFQYSTGILAIEWKYKYCQQEMIYSNNLYDARNVSGKEQGQILKNLIEDFNQKLKAHIEKVDKSEIKDKILTEYGITKEQMQKPRDFLNGL